MFLARSTMAARCTHGQVLKLHSMNLLAMANSPVRIALRDESGFVERGFHVGGAALDQIAEFRFGFHGGAVDVELYRTLRRIGSLDGQQLQSFLNLPLMRA